MDPRARFTATVDDYRRYRPDYPSAFFEAWCERTGLEAGARVIDLGCGTGIASRQLAAHGFEVTGIDPNPAMLEAAREEGGGVRYEEGDAETLAVPEPVDAIVGGQCFHWVDLGRALPVMRAALRPGARMLAFWNLRDGRDPFMAAYEALLVRHCPEYLSVGAEPRARAVASDPGLRNREEFERAHHQVLDRDGFAGRVWSSSYVRHSVEDATAFDREVGALFEAHQAGGEVRFCYRTWGVLFS
ncbi:MAG: trans-aconitate 2-methyltransferase [Sandaracinaceae bacterium]